MSYGNANARDMVTLENSLAKLPEVKKSLEKMAEAKYVQTGYQEAKIIIDDMEASEVKRYLSELIKDNITVGIEIIRNGRK